MSTQLGTTVVIAIQGNLTGESPTEFETHVRNAFEAVRHIVLDMTESGYFGPNTLGSLVHLMASMQQRKLHLWLAGMRPHLVRLLRSSRLNSYFRITSSVADALLSRRKGRAGCADAPAGATKPASFGWASSPAGPRRDAGHLPKNGCDRSNLAARRRPAPEPRLALRVQGLGGVKTNASSEGLAPGAAGYGANSLMAQAS